MSLLPNLDQMTDNEKLAVLESIQKSIAESKEIQKKKIGENVDLVVQALKKIESDIQNRFDAVGNTIEKRVASIQDGRNGSNGIDGRDGKDGKSGRDGSKGDKGDAGLNGSDGVDGVDGVSVVNANIDFDGSLIISLSDGREINVGEVVSADIAEKIKVISTMSTNGAIAVKEEGTTITSGVKSINFVGAGITATTSGDDVTVTVAGGGGSGTVTSVSALTLGTSGTDLSSTVANSTTTPVITLNVPTASATNRGALSSADWTTFNSKGSGTVTSVTGTSPVASSGGATPAISLSAGYGDTLNPYASKTANFVLAAPNGSAGVPTFRAIVAADIPTLNQNTTGTASNVTGTVAIANGGSGQTTAQLAINAFAGAVTSGSYLRGNGTNVVMNTIQAADVPTLNQSTTGSAATLTTPRAIYGNNFDGSAALAQVIAGTYGGTGVNNGANTITIAGNISHAGAFTQTFTATANTSVTLPTTGTLATLAGSESFTNKTLTNPTVTNYVESVVAIGTVTTSNTIALTNGTVQTATLTASTACTFTMPTATAGKSFVLLLKQAAATGNGTATFTSVKFGSAGAPTITATAGKMDILTFIADGTNWYGSIAQGYTP